MTTGPKQEEISARAQAIARGLFRTVRAAHGSKLIHGMLRLQCHGSDNHYWIALDGSRVLRGRWISEAEELQPTFVDAMERAGR
jgi:hypothetical protein